MRISDWSSDVCSSDLVWVTGKTPIEGGADAVLAALRESQQVAVAPPAVATGAAFAYRDFGAPGRIVSDDRIADLGIRRIRFPNDVMLNIKNTDFKKDTFWRSVPVHVGTMLRTPDDPPQVARPAPPGCDRLPAHNSHRPPP